MRFGENDNFARLQRAAAGDENEYAAVIGEVNEFCLRRLRAKGCTCARRTEDLEPDLQDIVQEVQLAVFRGLVRFVRESAEKSERERDGWLNAIILNKINDMLRHKYRSEDCDQLADQPEDLDNCIDENAARAMEGAEEHRLQHPGDLIYDSIRTVCSWRTAPEMAIAFFLNGVAYPAALHRSSGSPRYVAAAFRDKTLDEALRLTRLCLIDTLRVDIPEDAFLPLLARLNEKENGRRVGERVFVLSEHAMSDSTSRLKDRLAEKLEKEAGNNGKTSHL